MLRAAQSLPVGPSLYRATPRPDPQDWCDRRKSRGPHRQAGHDATYLLSKVEVVATYKLAGINRTRMENLFHKLFASARLNITIDDRFGNPVIPRE